MINYAWKSIKEYKNRSILFIVALVTIFVVLPLSLLTMFQVQTEIDGQIRTHARGSYDLLIRPEGSRTQVEKELGVVEENYLGVGAGGITLEEWQEMKVLSDVEVAAPVASLGYFNGGLKTLEHALPESSRWMGVSYETTDGIHQYPLVINEAYYLLEQEGFYYGYESLKNPHDNLTPAAGHPPLFSFPITYHLTVGVDREEEEKLTGFDLSKLNKKIDEGVLGMLGYTDEKQIRPIPVIYLEDARSPVSISISSKEFKWTTEDTIAYKEKLGFDRDEPFFFSDINSPIRSEILEELEKLTDEAANSVTTTTYDLSNRVRPFLEVPLFIDNEGNVDEAQSSYQDNLYTSNFYYTNPVDYEISGNELFVRKVGEEAGIPLYRETKLQENDLYKIEEIPFTLHPVGTFTTEAYQDTLAASPLGIYQQAPTTLKNGGILQETILPGSFVSAPAHGLMDIEDAAYIKGEAPIDAVRIRVADINGYDAAAEEKILTLAEQIHQLGQFEIDVVAGSSPMPMILFVEDIGEVSQPWTSLGAAAKITENWSFTNIIIACLFMLVSVSYILNRFLFRRLMQVEERQLLLELGWKEKHVRAFYLGEYVILTLVSILIASLILYLFMLLGLVGGQAFLLFAITVGITIVLIFTNVLLKNRPLLVVPCKVKRMSLLFRNIFYYKRFISLTFLQLATVTMLALFVGSSIFTTMEATGKTNLGSYVNDTLIVSLLLIIIASLILAIITVSESTSSFLALRKEEIETLRDIGWKKSDVLFLYLKESSLWSIIAILLGGFVSIVLIGMLYTLTLPLILMATGLIVLLCGLVTLLAYVIMRRHLMMVG